MRRRAGVYCAHVGHETIALARLSDDEAVGRARRIQGAPKRGDLLVEIVLLDDPTRPDRGHQLVLGQCLAVVLDQIQQRLEHLRGQCDRRALAQELPCDRVQSKPAEQVGAGWRIAHLGPRSHKKSEFFIPDSKDFQLTGH